uniref:DUF3456 domain-containing protein n=1 Tax=Plectus sambesii TaxID=2011161 RepID=A0A914VQM4_9BILA
MHFAGGNTDWEERNLGKFAKSETRLVEVMEHVCRNRDLPAELEGLGTGKDTEHR